MTTAIQNLIVHEVSKAAEDVLVYQLAASGGADLAPWEPGAHIDIHTPSGLIRQYSLCGQPSDRKQYQIAVLIERNGRGGSIEIHEKLTVGTSVKVSIPRNHFPLRPAQKYIFVGGGIGITPLLPMIDAAQQSGAAWSLVYGGRNTASMAFADALGRLHGETVTLVPQDVKGMIDIKQIVEQAESDVAVYACGPGAMLTELETQFEQAGKRTQLFIERFGVDEQKKLIESAGESQGFQIELAQRGLTLDVPADKTLKEVLLGAGIDVPFSCEEGYCGSCETKVLEGVPEHHCSVLTDEEKEQGEYMMVCVGRSKSAKLVLDL
ncbi:PDR/VanB family oxidoreductase [Eoetvoesiella caeni]|uniref:Ferredoxin-NADP reductase n=1 Tax=Eoetvoesiella caeni TaxID=645616 RepID=A0A366H323_9BURK|nr:PDR/VanB family oxidoreductase [Eoetvoesiella caeni]MCI2810984.1 PDR/VanB family oxidoreductase [Eoetvoesiella caeni]NYT56882.1 oxidoreductase [Eoetvoesiella caeni]RBP35450.1 ferredoxin-NADP reductase [Eoetvoesiella caeni]